jgi:hypothetical protein
MARCLDDLLAGPCPPLASVLTALSAEFAPVDGAWVDDRLDDLARPLFASAALPVQARSVQLAATIDRDPGFRPDVGPACALHLDAVLERRAGHPMLLAVVLAETGRRAGLQVDVMSAAGGWYAGVAEGERLWLIATSPGSAEPADPIRRHCGHELALAVCAGLAQRYERQHDARRADRARRLQAGVRAGGAPPA